MVSYTVCPRCGKKVNKKAEVCYNCKRTLKPHKKLQLSNPNLKSKLDIKTIAVGILIFTISTAVLINVTYDFAVYTSGFFTMVYLYYMFKDSQGNKNIKQIGIKLVIHYIIIVTLGILTLLALGFY